jgi:hypothetical protein
MNHVHADGEGKPVVTNTSTATAGCIAASLRQAAELIEAGAPIHSGGIMVQTEETVVRITSDLVLHRIAIPLPGAYAPTEQPLHEKSQPKSDREADRARFTDKDFNRWLDDGISDAGHTVWDAVGCIASAWAGWEARSMLNWNAHQLEHPEAVTTQALLAEVQELIGNEYMDARARRRLTGWLEKAQAFMAPTEPGLPYPTVPSLIGLAEVLPPKPIDGAPYMATMTAPQATELHKRFGALVRALADYPQKNTHQLQAAKVCAGVDALAKAYAEEGAKPMSEGDMERALQWVREETQGTLGQRENLPLIEEAVAAYDPERVARAGHTVQRDIAPDVRAVVQEYIEAREAVTAATKPPSQWSPPIVLPHSSPLGPRIREAWAALRALVEAAP